MRKLQGEDAEVMRIAIQREIGLSEESRFHQVLEELLLVTTGQSRRKVAELFGEDGTAVQFDHVGLESGLASGDSQSRLPDTRRSHAGRQRLLRSLPSPEPSAVMAMMHYLPPCVDYGTEAVTPQLLVRDVARADVAHWLSGPSRRRVPQSSGASAKSR